MLALASCTNPMLGLLSVQKSWGILLVARIVRPCYWGTIAAVTVAKEAARSSNLYR
jgi:hypothetical protein